MKQSKQFVESLSRGVRVLSVVCESRKPLSLSKLASKSELSISTVQRLSYTLYQLGLIDRDHKTKKFLIGSKMIILAMTLRHNHELKRVAQPFMQETSDIVDEVVGLGVLSGTKIVLVEIIKTYQMININMNPGAIIPPHASATGKAILAFIDGLRVDEILKKCMMPRFTQNTITSAIKYIKQLKAVRELGYSLAMDENADGFSAIAAPVRDSSGATIAAVTIMVPSARISKELLVSSYSKKVIQCADKISAAIGYCKKPL